MGNKELISYVIIGLTGLYIASIWSRTIRGMIAWVGDNLAMLLVAVSFGFLLSVITGIILDEMLYENETIMAIAFMVTTFIAFVTIKFNFD